MNAGAAGAVSEGTMLTLFTAPKAFRGHIGIIQANAIRSWTSLGSDVEVLLVGEEPGLAEAAEAFAVRHLSVSDRAESGAPSLPSVFAAARQAARHPFLCYLNADILLLDDFLPAVGLVTRRLEQFLVIGQRWDLDVTEPLAFGSGWEAKLRDRVGASGRYHRPVGSDYFVFPRDQYPDLPDFTIGRSAWDNWMIYDGRRRRIPVIDASQVITVVHQNHDYSHLPGGAPHHRHPESLRNLEIAGGREVVFRLEDADWRLSPEGPVRKGRRDWRYPRRWEADLMIRFGPGRLARLVRLIFRPRLALRRRKPTSRGEQGPSRRPAEEISASRARGDK
jgi:hypothetical protein